MKAIVFRDVERVELADVPEPRIEAESDVIVRVEQAGICGSDLHILHGRERGLDTGTVMGHEFVGEIVETGPAVKKFHCGDRVGSPFSVNCGSCFFCERGLTARCVQGRFFGWVQNGVGLHGGQAEYVRVPFADNMLARLPTEVPAELALLLGDNFATGFFCADMAEVKPGGTYAVIGCGMVGLIAILATRERGAESIIAIDMVERRRDMALRMGATAAVTPQEARDVVHAATAGRGADAVLEAVGSPSAQALAITLVRPCGILAVAGMHTAPQFAFSPLDAYNLNLTYKTGRCPARTYMERLAPVLVKHQKLVEGLLSHRLPLSAGVEGYRMFDNKQDNCTKVILYPAFSPASAGSASGKRNLEPRT